MATFTAGEILDQLDDCANDFTFPMLDNGYYYPVDQRLHAYADENRWALLIETLGYNPRAGNLIDVLHKYGNSVGKPGVDNDDFFGRIENNDELDRISLNDRDWRIASGVTVRGITLSIPSSVVPGTELEDLFRVVVPQDRLRFMATEEELRARVPRDLRHVLTLDEWNHPDLLTGQLPSGSETFQQLADVLVNGDPTLYAPSHPPNTDWRNWPEGGAL